MTHRAADAIAEIFTWVGFGGTVLVGLVLLIAWLADGSWHATQIVLSDERGRRAARWFGTEGRVGHAWLTAEQEAVLSGRETADAFVRADRDDRMRLTKGSPLVRLLAWLTGGFFALGVVAAAASLVLLLLR